MNFKKLYLAPIVTLLSTGIAIIIGIKTMHKSHKRVWLANMIGGTIFSQLQTEYLIWRINKKTEQIR